MRRGSKRRPTYLIASRAEQIEAQLRDSLEETRSTLQRFVSETVKDDRY
jgi:hypothetical protein